MVRLHEAYTREIIHTLNVFPTRVKVGFQGLPKRFLVDYVQWNTLCMCVRLDVNR